MIHHLFSRLCVVTWIIIALALVPICGALGAELAKEQVARLAMGVADIGTVDPHFFTKIGEGPVIYSVYEAMRGNEKLKVRFQQRYTYWKELIEKGLRRVLPDDNQYVTKSQTLVALLDGLIIQNMLEIEDLQIRGIVRLIIG